jgi:hypothetical protein
MRLSDTYMSRGVSLTTYICVLLDIEIVRIVHFEVRHGWLIPEVLMRGAHLVLAGPALCFSSSLSSAPNGFSGKVIHHETL